MVWGPVAWIPRIVYEIDCCERGTPIGTICINLLVVDSRNETKRIEPNKHQTNKQSRIQGIDLKLQKKTHQLY